MAGKWKYEPIIQQDEKEEERVLINNYSINNLDNQDLTNIVDPYSNFELKQRGNENPNQFKNKVDSIELVEYYTKPNDSLLSISLSCNCSVEELKRVNKLITDQEFYALRYIKIPVRKYGLLSEVLIHQLNQTNKSISIKEIKESLTNSNLDSLNNESSNNLLTNQQDNHLSNNSLNNQQQLINQDQQQNNDQFLNSQPLINLNDNFESFQSQPIPFYKSSDANATSSKSSSTNSLVVNVGLKKTFDFDKTDGDLNKFLVYLDKDLEKMRELTTKHNHSSIIESNLNPKDHLLILTNRPSANKNILDCNGADCNLTWKSAFFIAIFICILVPLIYVAIYAEEKSLNHHLNHH